MTNRLINEHSPYLLQHAHNPVDWHPWSEEAFHIAKEQDKPVFLSIGYSTCHWCHVMAYESFEDPEVANLINDAFVPVKVDREERPDIDQIYMAACQMMTGRGGWPLTIIMTPDKKPFFAATYIPKEGRFGSAGLLELIPAIKNLWANERKNLLESAEQISGLLMQERASQKSLALDESLLKKSFDDLSARFDFQNGGFGTAPKFPTPHNLFFLLRYWLRTGNANALDMVETTLQAMRMGGIYDHLGFGFHRYSTDARWFAPHFEKMLYDQALLLMAYVEAYLATGKKQYAATAREIVAYILRDMTSNEGGFYSAEDADSEGIEGKFYLWSAEELVDLLGKENYRLMNRLFDLQEGGNFERGANILTLRSSFEDASEILHISEKDLQDQWERIRLRLFESREKRVHPHKDDKILTDWNGLMIAALAKAAQALDEPRYSQAASAAADLILSRMQLPDGRLMHRFRDVAGIQANLDDYSFMIWGLIELYQAVLDERYLQKAVDLYRIMVEHFWDQEKGGFYFVPDDAQKILVRRKEIYDGAVPSGNSVAMLNLLRLSHLTGDHQYEEMADRIWQAFSGQADLQPSAYAMFLTALDLAIGPGHEVAIVGDIKSSDTAAMLKAFRSQFNPNSVLIFVPSEKEPLAIAQIAKFAGSLVAMQGSATAYVCTNHSCDLPTTNPSKMLELLRL